MEFEGNVSASTVHNSARLVCRNCGSHDIIEGLPEIAVAREPIAVPEKEGNSFGRR